MNCLCMLYTLWTPIVMRMLLATVTISQYDVNAYELTLTW
jgi:hypothetical protein